jgi:hypothetical protein
MSFTHLNSTIIVVKSRDVVLLPVAERNLKHTRRRISYAAKAMLLVDVDPNLVTRSWAKHILANHNFGPPIQYDPQLGPAGMGLKA